LERQQPRVKKLECKTKTKKGGAPVKKDMTQPSEAMKQAWRGGGSDLGTESWGGGGGVGGTGAGASQAGVWVAKIRGCLEPQEEKKEKKSWGPAVKRLKNTSHSPNTGLEGVWWTENRNRHHLHAAQHVLLLTLAFIRLHLSVQYSVFECGKYLGGASYRRFGSGMWLSQEIQEMLSSWFPCYQVENQRRRRGGRRRAVLREGHQRKKNQRRYGGKSTRARGCSHNSMRGENKNKTNAPGGKK